MSNTTIDAVDLGSFEFECGETIPNLRVAYETYGEFDGDNAILICHALTGSSHVTNRRDPEKKVRLPETGGQARAWWSDVVGAGKAIDTNKYFVVCPNLPGSCYGTTGPASTNPETGEPYGTDFPPVTVTDWTRAQRKVLDELGVGRLHAVVGGSVGGMNVLDWLKQYPDDVHRAVPIATAARLDPQCIAMDAVARRSITSDPNWKGGDYYDGQPPKKGLALARQLGHIMYLSKASMEQRFGRRAAGREAERELFETDRGADYFPYRDVESYLDYNAQKFVQRFDANSYLYLTRAMDNYDLASGYESNREALAAFSGEVLIMSFTGDWHFTVEQAADVADGIRETDAEVAHHVIESEHGHDAFLVEPENVGPPVEDFLADGTDGRSVIDTKEIERKEKQSIPPVHSSLF
ncbi:homoserine O-acetyltransferase [Salinarchaeum sp. IM2453]|uniref:homoserine O-acetyltransferase MetX n=1 Tax=Salinarchaeum sp. IM2453 TaxID=2862870 RepID=UPI001C82E2E1|nr:homoserine O-acetyltransferase [Salinarchaeum sp. IM2453]QZA89446.1 homoserine O-acetyltransferase [Salinarchaeum sp. IM2453]